jgi:hypothetical protein
MLEERWMLMRRLGVLSLMISRALLVELMEQEACWEGMLKLDSVNDCFVVYGCSCVWAGKCRYTFGVSFMGLIVKFVHHVRS